MVTSESGRRFAAVASARPLPTVLGGTQSQALPKDYSQPRTAAWGVTSFIMHAISFQPGLAMYQWWKLHAPRICKSSK